MIGYPRGTVLRKADRTLWVARAWAPIMGEYQFRKLGSKRVLGVSLFWVKAARWMTTEPADFIVLKPA